jgi:hypothetical protein
MEYCSYEEAFPEIHTGSIGGGTPLVGCTDKKATKEERRAAKRRAKKCKSEALKYLTEQEEGVGAMKEADQPDPDRPAVKRMEGVDSLQQQTSEGFRPPVTPGASCLVQDAAYPSYFGKGVDDADETEEGFSTFTNIIGDDPNYRLEGAAPVPTPTTALPSGEDSVLPVPSVSDTWKPMTPSGASTSFFKYLPAPGGSKPKAAPPRKADVEEAPTAAGTTKKDEKESLVARMDQIMGRLEFLEKRRVQNTQTELLMFVGTGVFMLFVLEFASRR